MRSFLRAMMGERYALGALLLTHSSCSSTASFKSLRSSFFLAAKASFLDVYFSLQKYNPMLP